MTPHDLATLHAAAFKNTRSWTEAEFADLLGSDFSFVEGDDSGFALGRVIADEAELLTLATLPSLRRQGFARHWLARFEYTAKKRGAATAFLEVAEDNTAAIALYLSAGYAKTGARSNYYTRTDGLHVGALIMAKTLP